MRDPKWIGVSPSNIRWADDSKKIYFNWNPGNTDRDELFSISPADIKPVNVSISERKKLPSESGQWNKKHTLKLFEKNGDIFLEEQQSGKIVQMATKAGCCL